MCFQRLEELCQLSQASSEHKETFRSLLHNTNPEKPDFTLSFLDDYVSASLENGGRPYRKTAEKSSLEGKKHGHN